MGAPARMRRRVPGVSITASVPAFPGFVATRLFARRAALCSAHPLPPRRRRDRQPLPHPPSPAGLGRGTVRGWHGLERHFQRHERRPRLGLRPAGDVPDDLGAGQCGDPCAPGLAGGRPPRWRYPVRAPASADRTADGCRPRLRGGRGGGGRAAAGGGGGKLGRQPAGARLRSPGRSLERPPAVALEPAGAIGDQAQQRAGHGHAGAGHQHRHPAVRTGCGLVGRPAGAGRGQQLRERRSGHPRDQPPRGRPASR